jgi:hypothetical protein
MRDFNDFPNHYQDSFIIDIIKKYNRVTKDRY